MYKGRLKAWGLLKNLKSKDADQIMGLAKSGVATGPLVIRGRSMGSKKWQKRLNRVTAPDELTGAAMGRHNGIVVALPLPGHLAAPDTLRLTEAGLIAIRDFATLQFNTQAWDLSGLPYDFDSDKTDNWSTGIMLAAQNLVKDRTSANNFAILNKCFDQYAAVVEQASPMLIPSTLNNVIRLLPVPEIAQSLLSYAANLISIRLGEDHPLSRLLSQLHILGAAQVPLVARTILSAYFDIIVSNSHPANRWRSSVYPHYAKLMQTWGAMPGEVVTTVFHKTIHGIEQSLADEALVPPGDAEASEHREQLLRHLQEAKMYFALYLIDTKRFLEADTIAEEMSEWLRSGGAARYPEQYEQWLRTKARILVGLDRPDEATPYFVQTYEARRDRLGYANHRTTRAISELEEHYRSLNDDEAAEKLHREFEESYEDV
ncbi:hypothetical protein PFICI_07139 [Pestalotiopsis fici W106-1]|uniref:Clr5 domain-containing protein n=1 Tax=Pestalotiopsis fici (strain W106-1 / CGMCC3.15140) TaxID=1229662 RepID=W3X9P5_PESFW|nr:uncharacterized protein PFICI_07139 [Pestalotiopsis fici W106-1]ETS82137.1 hypothetical protein PFICI_07139 [Pestalotiopsis fici W106-1]